MKKQLGLFGGAAAAWLAFGTTGSMAASTIVVTPTNTQGWSTADTRPGGTVNFVTDSTAPAGVGALQLTTDSTTTSKAQYLHAANTALSNVSELSYYTKQVAASFPGGDPSYQLPVYLNGSSSGFTTLVFEPYENGAVTPGTWQKWDVASGKFWSSRTVTCSGGTVTAGGGGAPFYTLAELHSLCPDAVAIGFGVNIGTNNPSYTVETDLVSFNGNAYDFEPYLVAGGPGDCKDGAWTNSHRADGSSFKNQGDCMQYVNTGE